MIHIHSFEEQGRRIHFWFSPEDGLLYRDDDEKRSVMGRPENFVYPHVHQPQNMKTYPARKLTLFCKDWLANHQKVAS